MVYLSKNKSLKIYKNISKLHFALLRCKTACFEELPNQQKNEGKGAIYKKNRR